LFERALAAAPITLPAHVSLFTGQYPYTHGVRNNGEFALADRVPTLATALHDRGYRTAAFVSAFVLDRRYGLARGFDAYDDRLDAAGEGGGGLERRGDRTVAAGDWLVAHATERTLERAGREADARREYQRLVSGRDTPPYVRQAARARLR
jgi:sulfatase-like protein